VNQRYDKPRQRPSGKFWDEEGQEYAWKHGKSFREIAKIKGMTPNAVENIFKRAIGKLNVAAQKVMAEKSGPYDHLVRYKCIPSTESEQGAM